LFIIGPSLRYLFRKKTSEPRRLPALFTVRSLTVHTLDMGANLIVYYWARAAVSV
jgi:hypothetical protein